MSNVQPSVDPVPTLLEPAERTPFDGSVAAGLVGLVYLARQAFEEKRRRQCLEITDAILRIEPEHSEALSIQSSVRSELERDFSDAQALVQDAKSKGDPGFYVEAAAILRRLVDAEPDNLEAQNLLHETVAAGHFSRSSPAEPSKWTVRQRFLLIGSAVLVVVAVFAVLNGMNPQVSAQIAPRGVSTSIKTPQSPAPSNPPDSQVTLSSGLAANLIDPQASAVAVSLGPVPLRIDEAQGGPPSVVPQPPSPVPSALATVDASVLGEIAVNATVPVEIYRRDQYLGSTPITLRLPPGPQTLEYRYQGLRQTSTHLVKAHETTTAIVSFPVKVQINAKPWAQVSLEGTRLTPLGQTPLGNVSVPIGSVLVFQNPGFSDKRYRVTARDATIQVTFP